MNKKLPRTQNFSNEDIARILSDVRSLIEFFSDTMTPKDHVAFLKSTEFDADPTASIKVNMLQWRGTEKGLHSFWKFNQIHRWLIADDESHFEKHLNDKLLPEKKLIVGTRINDVIHIFKGLHEKRLLSFYDTLQSILADHCLDQKEQELDPQGSMKTAVHKNPIIGSAKRAAFLDQIIEEVVRDNG